MQLHWQERVLSFTEVPLVFEGGEEENVFANKNNKSLAETLQHRRYTHFQEEVYQIYSQYLDWELGRFLAQLKVQGDDFYLKFLNKYGDQRYCRFYIEDQSVLNKKGLYLYAIADQIKYVGRCRDSFRKRINQGYGKIHPKNCFIDGQATNCHLNALITQHRASIRFSVHIMEDEEDIKLAEQDLIQHLNPPWNIAK